MSNFFERVMKNIRMILYREARNKMKTHQERESWVDKKILSISRLKLYGFCVNDETIRKCKKLFEKPDFETAVYIVRKFHQATDNILISYDLEDISYLIISSLYSKFDYL